MSSSRPLQQNFDIVITLLQRSLDHDLISLLNTLTSTDLSEPLPSYTNINDYCQPLVYWCVIYERPLVIDYLVRRHVTLTLSSGSDALAFSIKMGKHAITQHLILTHHSSFDLINTYRGYDKFCTHQISYLDLLD